MVSGVPVVVVPSGGLPVVISANGGAPVEQVTANGIPVTISTVYGVPVSFTGGAVGAALRAVFPFPVGQALPTGYTAGNTTMPFAAAQTQFDATILENAHKAENLLTVVGPPRTYSMTSALALEAASPMAVYCFHSLNFPNGEPASGFTLSSLPADPNYWKTDVTARVNQIAAQTSNFAAYPVIEIGNELVAVDGTTAHDKFAAAAAADATWGIDPILHLRQFYDAVKAVNTTARLAVGDFQIEDAGFGFAVNPRALSATAHPSPSTGIAYARKRPQIVKMWQTFLNDRPHRGYMRLQGHFDASQPFYREELLYFLDELFMFLRVDMSLEEVNAAVEWSEYAFPTLTTTALKRRFAARHAAFVARTIADRCGLQALIGWTGFGTDGRTRITIMEGGVLSELGEELRRYFTGWSSAPQAQYRAMRACEVGSAAEAAFLPYWSGITTMGWGAYGSGGAMALDMTGYKMRTADNAGTTIIPTTNASQIVYQRLKSVGSGRVLFDMKASGGASFIKAQTNASGRVEIILDGTTYDLGAYAAGDLVKIVVDHDGTATLKAVMNRYTSGAALIPGTVVTRSAPAATQIASIAFPEASGEIRTFYHTIHYGPSRFQSDAELIAGADPTPVQHVPQATIEAVPAMPVAPSLQFSATSFPEHSAVGTTIGAAVPVNALNPGAVSVYSQSVANRVAMSIDGRTIVVGSGATNFESNPSSATVFEFTDARGVWRIPATISVTDINDAPTTSGATTTLDDAIAGATVGVAITADLRDFFTVASGQTLAFTVSHGSVGGDGHTWTWTPAIAGSATVTVTATDQDAQSGQAVSTVTVAAANTPPVAADVTLNYIVPEGVAATAPSQFGTGDWAVSDAGTNGDATVTISTLPSNGGSAITALQYQLDGGSWASLGGTTTGAYGISGLTDGTPYTVAIRAVNAVGNGTASATKSVTPTGIPSPFTAGMWTVSDLGTGGTARIAISSLPSNGGSAITALQRKIGAGAWTSLGGTTVGNYDVSGFTDGVATNVLIRAVNANGNGTDSDTKLVTTTAPAGLTLVNSAKTVNNNSATLVVTRATGLPVGALEIMCVGLVGSLTINTPAGYTLKSSHPGTSTAEHTIYVFHRTVDGSEGSTVTVSHTTGTFSNWLAHSFGYTGSTGLGNTAGSAAFTSAGGTKTAPTITALAGSDLLTLFVNKTSQWTSTSGNTSTVLSEDVGGADNVRGRLVRNTGLSAGTSPTISAVPTAAANANSITIEVKA